MPSYYQLNQIDIYSLHVQCVSLARSIPYGLKAQPPTLNDAYHLYCLEFRFNSILQSLTPLEGLLFTSCKTDLSYLHLYSCLAAWLRAPDSEWVWAELIGIPTTAPHYSLIWNYEAKAILVAARDLLGIAPIDLGANFALEQQTAAMRLAKAAFPD